MTWHLDVETIDRYVDGRPGLVEAASVEQHLLACEDCRDVLRVRVAAVEDLAGAHGATRLRLRRAVLRPGRSLVERTLLALRVPDSAARLVAASPAFRSAAWLATAMLLVVAVLMSYMGSGTVGTVVFMVTAPVVPLAGVAVAYGWWAEPTRELATTVPYSRWRLALLRTAVVLAISLLAVGGLALALPHVSAAAWLWLIPSLSLTSVSLALSSWVDPARATLALGVVWIFLAGSATRGPRTLPAQDLLDQFVGFRTTGQAFLLAVGVAAVVVTMLRRPAYEERSRA